MKVDISDGRKPLLTRLHRLTRTRAGSLVLAFLLYHLIFAVVVFSLYRTSLSSNSREMIFAKSLALAKGVVNWSDKLSSRPMDLPFAYRIDLKDSDEEVLRSMIAKADGFGFKSSLIQESVPALLTSKDKAYEVDLSIFGDVPYDGNSIDQWPLKINLKNDQIFSGMHCFYLHPLTEKNIGNWLMHKLMTFAGLQCRGYELIDMKIAGAAPKTYIAEESMRTREQYDREIDMEVGNFYRNSWQADLEEAMPNTSLPLNEVVASHQKETDVLEVFDLHELATYFALMELFGGITPAKLINLRYYANTNSNRLKLLIDHDLRLKLLERNGLLGAELQFAELKNHRLQDIKPTSWYKLLFRDTTFFQIYIEALEKISADQFINDFFSANEVSITKIIENLSDEKMKEDLPAKAIILKNQEFISNAMRPARLVQAAYIKDRSSAKSLHFDISNIHNLPVEVLAIWIADSIELGIVQPSIILPANQRSGPVDIESLVIQLTDSIVWNDLYSTRLRMKVRVLGARSIRFDEVTAYGTQENPLFSQDLMRRSPNISDFEFLTIDEIRGHIKFKVGKHQLREPLIVPQGYQLEVHAGTQIDVIRGANIVSYSPLRFIGKEGAPITIFSSDSSAQGITVLKAHEESILHHVKFHDLSNPNQGGWSLTSAITFYESPVDIDYCSFEDNRAGDDYLNIVRGEFSMRNSIFRNSKADAFDGDFCRGEIHNTKFFSTGNDAIDISGSNLIVSDILMDEIGDKGISAGENSLIDGVGLHIMNAEIAVTSKDLSKILIRDIEIVNSRIAYTAFEKKPEFGPASIEVEGNSSISGMIEIPYLIERGSIMKMIGKDIKPSKEISRVEQILYGVKFGKSSS